MITITKKNATKQPWWLVGVSKIQVPGVHWWRESCCHCRCVDITNNSQRLLQTMERAQHFVPSSDFRFTLLHQIVLMETEIQKEKWITCWSFFALFPSFNSSMPFWLSIISLSFDYQFKPFCFVLDTAHISCQIMANETTPPIGPQLKKLHRGLIPVQKAK